MMQPFFMKRPHLLDATLLLWLAFSSCYLIFKINPHTELIAAYLALFGQSGLNLLAAVVMFLLWKKTEDIFKPFLFALFLSFVAAFVAGSLYHFLLHINGLKLTPTVYTLIDVPFLCFLLLQFIAWYRLFQLIHQNNPYTQRQMFSSVSAPILFLAFTIFAINKTTDYFSVIGLFHLIQHLFEAINLYFVSLCLLKLRPFSVRLMCYGFCCILVSELSIRYGVITNHSTSLNAFEPLWVLGLMFYIIGGIFAYSEGHIHDSFSFQLVRDFMQKLGFSLENRWEQKCICSKEIDSMMRFLLANTNYDIGDLADLLELTTKDYDNIKMMAITDEKTYGALWMLFQVAKNDKTLA